MEANKDEKSTDSFSSPSRRDFLKIFGASAIGGLTALALPDALKAELPSDTALEGLASGPGSCKEELDWYKVRLQFVLRPDIVYMNTGTEGSMPRPVLDHVNKDMKAFAQFPMDVILYDEPDKHCCMTLEAVRAKTAEFLGCNTDEVVMTTNTTEGLSWIANGLDLQPDDEVLTSLHFMPYNSCWYVMRDRGKVNLTEVELPTPAKSKDEIVSCFEQAITPRTKVMCFCHINFSTGLRMPVSELCQMARSRGILTLVDGAHAPGMIDVNLHDLGCDFYACSLHKWLCGPPGTGALYIRKEVENDVWPVELDSYMEIKGTTFFQFRGQQCTPAYAGVLTAMDFQNAIGKDRIEARVMALNKYCKEELTRIYGEEKIFSPMEDELSTGMVSFNPFDNPYEKYGGPTASLFYGLYHKEHNKKKAIITRGINFKDKLSDSLDKRALRISTHIYNNYNEIDTALELIQEVVEKIKDGATYKKI